MIGVVTDEPIIQPAPSLPVRTIPKPPRPEKMLAIIRFLAPHSEKVVFSQHAQERMLERDITDVDVYRTLERGSLSGETRPGKEQGEWICKLTYQGRGIREIGVVVVAAKQSVEIEIDHASTSVEVVSLAKVG